MRGLKEERKNKTPEFKFQVHHVYKLVWCLFISAEQFKLDGMTKVFRNRIMDIRWFMRVLNEAIARKANFEDNCTRRLFGIR